MPHENTFRSMRKAGDASGAYRTWSRARIDDDDGVKTSFATSAVVQTFNLLGDFNGVEGAFMFGGKGPARSLTFTGAGAGKFLIGAPVTVTGWRGTADVTEVLTWASVNGGVLAGQKLFDGITSVVVDGLVDNAGTIKIGVADVAGPHEGWIEAVRLYAAGTLHVRYREGDADLDDALTFAAERTEVFKGMRLLAGSAVGKVTSPVALTVYF